MDVYEKIKESRNALSPFCQRLGIVVEELRESRQGSAVETEI